MNISRQFQKANADFLNEVVKPKLKKQEIEKIVEAKAEVKVTDDEAPKEEAVKFPKPKKVSRKKVVEEDDPKVNVHIRLPMSVLKFFKAGGEGYQTRITEVLLDYVKGQGAG